MKKAVFIISLLATTLTAFGQAEPPAYRAIVNRFQVFFNTQQNDSLYNMFAPIVQQKSPLDKTKEMTSSLVAQLGKMKTTVFTKIENRTAIYKTTFDNATLALYLTIDYNNKISGIFFRPFAPDNLIDSTDTAATKINYTCTSPGGKLNGILTMPKTTKKVPVVFIIAGSGPTDRNGNSGMGLSSNSYLMLAKALQSAGIACVRYDKRGVGTSTQMIKPSVDITFDDMVDDAVEYIKKIKADQQFSTVYILGHSEGALIGILAAQKEKVNGLISIAGAGRPMGDVIEQQLKEQHPDIADAAVPVIDSLKNGYSVNQVPPMLQPLFGPTVQTYMKSVLKYDGAKELSKLKIPVLIVQGTTDIQTSMQDAEKLKAAKPDATLKIIPGMNHIMKEAPADPDKNKDTYSDPKLPLKTELVTDITKFVLKR